MATTSVSLTPHPPDVFPINSNQQVIAVELPKELMTLLEIFTALHPVVNDC